VRPDPTSTRLTQVVRGTPADRAGLQIGDEVVSVNHTPVSTAEELVTRLHGLPAGKKVTIAIRRGGKDLSLSVTPETMPDASAMLDQTLLDKPAPDITADKLDGSEWKLSASHGHVVVVEFWATWCGPCRATGEFLDEWHARRPDLEIVGVTSEDEALVRAFVADHPHAYTLARDRAEAAWNAYLVQAIPTIVVIDKAGVVRYTGVGFGDFDKLDALVDRLSR